jgi:ADP-heptose:LPS heptosyltransferase
MNVIEKQQMLEGLSYSFSTSKELTEKQIDAIIHIRDTMRAAGLVVSADSFGRIVVRNSDQKQVAVGIVI